MSMSMYIGAMLRSWMKDAAQTDSRALELKVGHIVRGVLMQMLDDGEALMNIGGVPVRARLETELQPGKGTLLQVMPGSSGSTVLLKALGDAAGHVPDESLKEALKSFGLPDQKWSFDLLRGLRSDGYPINKETASYFQNASMLRPAGAYSASWMMAAGVAFRRGLEPSAETINALRQALFGQPFMNELAGFMEKLHQWMSAESARNPRAAELAVRFQALLAQGDELLNQGRQQLEKGALAQSGSSINVQQEGMRPSSAGRSPDGTLTSQQSAANMGGAARMLLAQGSTPLDADFARQSAGTTQTSSTPNSAANVSASHAGAAASRIIGELAQELAGNQQRASGMPLEASPAHHANRPEAANAGSSAMQPAAGKGDLPWIGRFLQWLGFSHEQQLAQEWGNVRRAAADQGLLPGETQLPAGERPAGESLRGPQDTLKSVLMQMARMEDFPPQIREAAQTLVQHITGQQLLLASERQAGNPVSIMTFFVPMKGENGETTATIHVQTRRGRKGEWDADNCRLLFDLNMRYLGETIVDVQVVDRIVSIKLMNDFPAMAEMAAQAREQLEEGLRTAGFQLLSMTVQPLPAAADQSQAEDAESPEPKTGGSNVTAFSSKPYKGVDYRI
jgi:hypothetical protein